MSTPFCPTQRRWCTDPPAARGRRAPAAIRSVTSRDDLQSARATTLPDRFLPGLREREPILVTAWWQWWSVRRTFALLRKWRRGFDALHRHSSTRLWSVVARSSASRLSRAPAEIRDVSIVAPTFRCSGVCLRRVRHPSFTSLPHRREHDCARSRPGQPGRKPLRQASLVGAATSTGAERSHHQTRHYVSTLSRTGRQEQRPGRSGSRPVPAARDP
jgi:hypothetical protein